MNTPITTGYLTPNQVALLLRVKPITVRRWIQGGFLAAEQVREGKRHRYLIKQAAVDALSGFPTGKAGNTGQAHRP